jgi:hypothetical protein
MRRVFLFAACMSAVALGMSWFVPKAKSLEAFKNEFKATYVRAKSHDSRATTFAAAVEKTGCYICHAYGKKKGFNSYGAQLARFLHKNDAGNRKKVSSALSKVAAMPSNPSDPNSPTFGERIRQGQLPIGGVSTPKTASKTRR